MRIGYLEFLSRRIAESRGNVHVKRFLKWSGASLAVLLVAGYFVLAHFMGGPRDVY